MKRFLIFAQLLMLIGFNAFAQERIVSKPWFISAGIGEQHSGIRSEDYVKDNFSPIFVIEGGKFISSCFALELGIKGCWYNFISDNDRHYYASLYGNLIFDIQNAIAYKEDRIWNTQVYLGGGLMYNAYHGLVSPLGLLEYPDGRLQPIINVGMSNLFRVSPRVQLGFDVGGICGWALYQDSCDMIPSAFLRTVYSFPM